MIKQGKQAKHSGYGFIPRSHHRCRPSLHRYASLHLTRPDMRRLMPVWSVFTLGITVPPAFWCLTHTLRSVPPLPPSCLFTQLPPTPNNMAAPMIRQQRCHQQAAQTLSESECHTVPMCCESASKHLLSVNSSWRVHYVNTVIRCWHFWESTVPLSLPRNRILTPSTLSFGDFRLTPSVGHE